MSGVAWPLLQWRARALATNFTTRWRTPRTMTEASFRAHAHRDPGRSGGQGWSLLQSWCSEFAALQYAGFLDPQRPGDPTENDVDLS